MAADSLTELPAACVDYTKDKIPGWMDGWADLHKS